MAVDLIRYDLLVQDALRGAVRKVLSGVARDGVPGEHHFYIGFRTHARGVRLSSRMRELYPDEMTIVLQHQFWDLSVTGGGFRGRSIVPKYTGNAAHPVRCGDPFCRSVRGIRVAVLGRGRGGRRQRYRIIAAANGAREGFGTLGPGPAGSRGGTKNATEAAEADAVGRA